jgi:hypothetical protein
MSAKLLCAVRPAYSLFVESLEDLSLVCFLLENQGPTIEKTASILSETMMENHVADLLY